MSREFYQTMSIYHQDKAKKFAQGGDGVKRHVEVRINDLIYVYLMEDDVHIQTQSLIIPEGWFESWPSENTVRRYIRSNIELGSARITTLDA